MSDFDFRFALLAFGGEPTQILLAVGKVYLAFGAEECHVQADVTDAEADFQHILLSQRVIMTFRVFSRPDFQKCTVPGTGNGRLRFSRQTGVENRGKSADQGNGSLGHAGKCGMSSEPWENSSNANIATLADLTSRFAGRIACSAASVG